VRRRPLPRWPLPRVATRHLDGVAHRLPRLRRRLRRRRELQPGERRLSAESRPPGPHRMPRRRRLMRRLRVVRRHLTGLPCRRACECRNGLPRLRRPMRCARAVQRERARLSRRPADGRRRPLHGRGWPSGRLYRLGRSRLLPRRDLVPPRRRPGARAGPRRGRLPRLRALPQRDALDGAPRRHGLSRRHLRRRGELRRRLRRLALPVPLAAARCRGALRRPRPPRDAGAADRRAALRPAGGARLGFGPGDAGRGALFRRPRAGDGARGARAPCG
jgi:hypothetical protein